MAETGYVYKITLPNNDCYVGSTIIDLKTRKSSHKSCLKKNNTSLLYIVMRENNYNFD